MYPKYAAVVGEKKGDKRRKIDINAFEAGERKYKNQSSLSITPLFFD